MTKAQAIVLTSPLICTVVGTIAGALIFPVLVGTVHSPSEALEMSLGLLPWAALYASPFGIAGGLFGAFAVQLLGNGHLKGASSVAWLRAGAGSGAVTGVALVAVLFPSLGSEAWAFAISSLVAGALSGVALGAMGWRHFGSASLSKRPAMKEGQ